MRLPPALETPLRRVEARLRLARALDAATLLLVPASAIAAIAIAATKTGHLEASRAVTWLAVAGALPVLGLLVGALRRVPRLLPAALLDRAHDLRSRVANALEFASVPDAERTPFMSAAVEDAVARANELDPSRAFPLRRPRDLGAGLACVALAAGVLALEVPVARRVPPPRLAPAAMLDDDSLEGFRSELAAVLEEAPPDPEVSAAARELNRILEDIADRRLDRTDALRELAELERRLADGRAADADTMDRALRELGRRLAGSSELTAASEALVDADAARAETAMREAAEAVRGEAMSRTELAELRRSLERAAERETEAERALARREEETSRLLERRRQEAASEESQEESLLRRRQRELERLEREQEQVSEQRRRLERLRREMQQAAEDLNRQRRDSAADAMERGAEDLNRTAREQMSEEQRRELEQQMRQLREMIRRAREQQQQQGGDGQGGQGQGQGQGQRLQRFVLRAQGQGGQPMRLRMPGQGQQGQGQGQQGQGQGQQGQGQGQQGQGQGQQGQGQGQQGQGQGQQGQGQGQAGGGQGGQGQGQGQGQGSIVELTMGQGGNAMLELPGMGEGGQGTGEGGGTEPGGGAGREHDPDMLGDPTHLNSRGQSSRVEGEHGQGPSRSEVILGAADRGFASTGYRRVFTDYEGHAEEVLERDEVPAGYRFYVRRYFQLIRPREGAAAAQAEPQETPR